MAESLPERGVGDNVSNVQPGNSVTLECAVCLQSCIHPAELPCGHVFCYLCIKGIVNRNRRCAMCRQSIPPDFLDKPRLLRPIENESDCKGFDDGHSWFYEGHNGWWQYDERTSRELEAAYQTGERCCEILVAGYVYVADFDSMLQYRRNDTCKRRRIKRDLITTNKKGVAGLKIPKETTPSNSANIVSNILIPGMQNLHISNRSADSENPITNLARLHNITREPFEHETSRTFPRGHRSLEPLRPIYPRQARANVTESNIDAEDNLYLRNPELEGIAHNSLDWTIQQIESLQAQLSSDYDDLSDDMEALHNAVGLRMRELESDCVGPRNESLRPERSGRLEDEHQHLSRSFPNDTGLGNRGTQRFGCDNAQENIPPCGHNGFQQHNHASDDTDPDPDPDD